MARVKILSTKHLDPSLVEQASERGVDVLEREFISVQLLHSEEKYREVQPWLQRAERSHVVFTSFNAVEAVRQYLHHEGSSPAPDWDVFCIAGRTREAVEAAFPAAAILATAEYGSALAQQIIDRGDIKEVVFFSGNRRREELPSMLKGAGISVHEITVYETEETPSPIEEDLDGVLFFSPSGVNSFFASNQLKKEAVCFAIGRTTAEAVASYTHNQIIISESTSPEAMLAAVYHFTQTINL